MKKILKIVNTITKWEIYLLGGIFLILSGMVFCQIILRTTRTGNLVWLDELCRIVMIDTSFVGACVALTRGELTSLNLVTDLLSEKVRHIVSMCMNLIGGIFSLWLGTCGWSAMVGMIGQGVGTVSLGIPYWLTYLPIAVALFGMGIRFLLLAWLDGQRIFHPEHALATEGGQA